MDAKIGQIIALLEELGIAENTLIIAMADYGPMEAIHPETGQNGFFRGGKNDVTEGGIRVPAFAYWPGVIEPGTVAGGQIANRMPQAALKRGFALFLIVMGIYILARSLPGVIESLS